MSIEIKLPDGTVKKYTEPVSGYEIASDIGSNLARDAV